MEEHSRGGGDGEKASVREKCLTRELFVLTLCIRVSVKHTKGPGEGFIHIVCSDAECICQHGFCKVSGRLYEGKTGEQHPFTDLKAIIHQTPFIIFFANVAVLHSDLQTSENYGNTSFHFCFPN